MSYSLIQRQSEGECFTSFSGNPDIQTIRMSLLVHEVDTPLHYVNRREVGA